MSVIQCQHKAINKEDHHHCRPQRPNSIHAMSVRTQGLFIHALGCANAVEKVGYESEKQHIQTQKQKHPNANKNIIRWKFFCFGKWEELWSRNSVWWNITYPTRWISTCTQCRRGWTKAFPQSSSFISPKAHCKANRKAKKQRLPITSAIGAAHVQGTCASEMTAVSAYGPSSFWSCCVNEVARCTVAEVVVTWYGQLSSFRSDHCFCSRHYHYQNHWDEPTEATAR